MCTTGCSPGYFGCFVLMPIVLDWIDPGNAGGSVRVPDAPRSGPVHFICPVCLATFDRELERIDHVNDRHPIQLPFLRVNGEAAAGVCAIRRPIAASAMEFCACDEVFVSVNGAPFERMTPDRASRLLAGRSSGQVVLRLANRHAETIQEIRIRIPTVAELDRVDTAFVRWLAQNDVTLTYVDRFRDEVAGCGSADDYAAALGDYVLGVLVKDRIGGATIPFERYADKFKGGLSVLHEFDTSLSVAVSNGMQFCLNQFAPTWKPCGVQALDAGTLFYMQKTGYVSANVHRQRVAGRRPSRKLCPVDETTALILQAVETVQQSGFRDVGFLERLEAVAASAQTSDPDRVKLHVLLANTYKSLGDDVRSVVHAERVTHDHDFGTWASKVFGVAG